MEIAALVLGIGSLIAAIVGGILGVGNFLVSAVVLLFALIGGIVGIIVSAMTMKNNPEKKGMGIGGLVTSIIGTVYALVCLMACVACAAACGSAVNSLQKSDNSTVIQQDNSTKADNSTTNNAVDNSASANQSNGTSGNGMSSAEFRKWVDDYEKFINDYVDFMNNYNPSDMSQLSKYTQLMKDYNKWIADTGKLNERDYTTDDWAYYLAAQARVTQKLTEVSSKMMGASADALGSAADILKMYQQ